MRPLALILLLAVACRNGSDDQNTGATSSDRRPPASAAHRGRLAEQQLTVLGLRSGSPEAAVTNALGRPDLASPEQFDPSVGDSVSTWSYDGILIKLQAHAVASVHCSAVQCATADGIRIGDSRTKVLDVYGSPRLVETTDTELWRYSGGASECWLDFTIKDGLVAAMDLSCG
jgi:hypothetical protein